MIKALFFDFDGVIVESADIKTAAFRDIFKKFPASLDKIVDYHKKNMGISRFVKFRYIFKNILKKSLSVNAEKELGKLFSEIVYEKVLKTPMVKGASSFLNANFQKYPLFLISGTPEEELLDIVAKRKLSLYFNEIHGAPKQKATSIRGILKRFKWDPEETVFIGDAVSDYEASQKTEVHFVARVRENVRDLDGCRFRIKDFYALDRVLGELNGEKNHA